MSALVYARALKLCKNTKKIAIKQKNTYHFCTI